MYPRLDGGQAELVRVPQADRSLRVLPDEVGDEAAVFLADILPTGYGAVVRGGVSAGDTVAVVGCGPVGLMAVLCAVGVAGRVIAVDGVAARRELAERLGAEAVGPEQAAAAVAEATGGLGADVVVEAAGSPGGLDASLRLARGRGMVSVVGAHFEPDYPLDNALMFERELTLRFSIGDPTADGDLLLGKLATRRARPGRGRHPPPAARRGGRGVPSLRLARGDEGGAVDVRTRDRVSPRSRCSPVAAAPRARRRLSPRRRPRRRSG